MRFPLPEEMQSALRALEPVPPEAVVIGGWAHRLHAEHPLAEPSFEPLTTTDCDVALPLTLAARTGASIGERLQEAGFECQIGGTTARHQPGASGSMDLRFGPRSSKKPSCSGSETGHLPTRKTPGLQPAQPGK